MTVRRLLTVCAAAKENGLRQLVVLQLQSRPVGSHTRQLGVKAQSKRWIFSVGFPCLRELDKALEWNDTEVECPHTEASQSTTLRGRPREVDRADYPAEGPRQWLKEVCDLLLMADEGSRAAGVAVLEKSLKAALRVWSFQQVVQQVWRLRSLHGVHLLTVNGYPPPFTLIKRSPAGRLRILLRGGIRCLLGWSVYSVLRDWSHASKADTAGTPTATATTATGLTSDTAAACKSAMAATDPVPPTATAAAAATEPAAVAAVRKPVAVAASEASPGAVRTPAVVGLRVGGTPGIPARGAQRIFEVCIYCGVELTVPHLVRDCGQFEEQRLDIWSTAWRIAESKAVVSGNGFQPHGGMEESVRQQWYLLTIGEGVSASFLQLGLEGWKEARATIHRNDHPSNGGVVLSRCIGVYSALLGVTGALLALVVKQMGVDVTARKDEEKNSETESGWPARPTVRAAATSKIRKKPRTEPPEKT